MAEATTNPTISEADIHMIEQNGFDPPFDTARVSKFSQRSEELLRYLTAAVASRSVPFLEFVWKDFKGYKSRENNDAYRGLRKLLEQRASGNTGRDSTFAKELWMNMGFRKILEAAVQHLGPRYSDKLNHNEKNDKFLWMLSQYHINSRL